MQHLWSNSMINNVGMIKWKVLSSLHSVYLPFSLWKSIEFFSSTPWICNATGHRPRQLPLTNRWMCSGFANHVLQNIPSSPVDFVFWVGCGRLCNRSPGTMIHRLCSICEPRYCSSGCQNGISPVGSVVQWPLSGLSAQLWNMVLSIPGGCNVNMLFFSTNGNYCTGEINGVQMLTFLQIKRQVWGLGHE